MEYVTDFADQAVMLPLAATVALALALSGWWRGCGAWVLCVVAVLGTIAVLKYVFYACSNVLGSSGISSPSGHTAAAAMIMGGATVMLLRERVPGWVLAALPVALAVVFAISRIVVHAHTVPEVIVGGIIGLIGTACLYGVAGPRPAGRRWPAVLAAALVLVGLHGLRLHAETTLHNFALFTWLPLPAICRI